MAKTCQLAGFQSRKAAQISAYFAQSSAAPIEKLKLVKLIYLAERSFISKYGQPMLYDEFFSLPHGPVCSRTLNGINSELDQEIWSAFIAVSHGGNKISATRTFNRTDFDEISDAELEVLQSVYEKFKPMTASQLRNYTHTCPEYKEVAHGREPITYLELFTALGLENPEHLADEVEQFRNTDALFSK